MENITTREQLLAFVERTGMTRWHEPDEHDVYAHPAVGWTFDNAFCDPRAFRVQVANTGSDDVQGDTVVSVTADSRGGFPEHGVFLFHHEEPVAFVNLAMLLALASGMAG
jgi:hypothetical protein